MQGFGFQISWGWRIQHLPMGDSMARLLLEQEAHLLPVLLEGLSLMGLTKNPGFLMTNGLASRSIAGYTFLE